LLKNFISNIIEEDIANHKNGGRVVTRFPPEPNGYLHLGHAKSVNFNFGIAAAYGGVTNMRFDDTNPAKEDMEYVLSILDDVRWLVKGDTNADPAPWVGKVRHASDYFQVIYDSAEYLIALGLAYVDDLTAEQMREYRGTLTEPGKNSPYRDRCIDENLSLFRQMKSGAFNDGEKVLRAKIDMSSPNMNLRDPTLYRIKRAAHPITGSQWLIYPMYDYAHAISDAMEGITHSLCTLEFADHRPLYDWTIDHLMPSGLLPFADQGWRPRQYEFSRLNVQFTVLSKRKLIQLVNDKHVNGWDDPRMPTICGMRRRGYPSSALRLFCDRTGISRADNNIDLSVLEECVREELDHSAGRAFGLLDPLPVTITNWPEDGSMESFSVPVHPKREEMGSRQVHFGRHLLIDREDFFDSGVDNSLSPPKGFKRLVQGGQVRLKFGYVITCDQVIRDEHTGKVVELRCSFDDSTKHGAVGSSGKKVKGIIQWLSSQFAVPCQVNLYDRLFAVPAPGQTQPDGDFLKDINPHSLQIVSSAIVENSLRGAKQGSTFQFERVGYFTVDKESKADQLVFNRVVTLKDTWAATGK